jgi:hypothetical protein
MNGVGLLLYCVAGAVQIVCESDVMMEARAQLMKRPVVNNLERGGGSCDAASLATLPFVADLLVLIALIFSLLL